MSHIIWNAMFERHNLGRGNDSLTYDDKGAWGKKRWKPQTRTLSHIEGVSE